MSGFNGKVRSTSVLPFTVPAGDDAEKIEQEMRDFLRAYVSQFLRCCH